MATGGNALLDASTGTVLSSQNPISNERVLSTITGINAKTVAVTALYTVPAGKTAIITRAVLRCTAADTVTGGPTALGIGVAGGEIDIIASMTAVGLVATGKCLHMTPILTGAGVTAAAAAVINLGITVGAVATTLTYACDLIGYLV